MPPAAFEEVNSTLFRVVLNESNPHSFDPHMIAAEQLKDQPFRQQRLTPSGRAALRITTLSCKGGKAGKSTFVSFRGVCAPSCEIEEHPIYCFAFFPHPQCAMVVRNLKFRADLDGESQISVSGPGDVTVVGELFWSFDEQDGPAGGKRGRFTSKGGKKTARSGDAENEDDEAGDSDDMYNQGIVFD